MRVLTTSQDGGWTQIPEAKGFYYNGVTYVGYVNGANGNVELKAWDNATHAVIATVVLHAALGIDTHNAPTVLVRSDGRIVAAYSSHSGPNIYVWISTNPEDISAGTETNITSSFGSGTYTYCTLAELSAESNKLYLFIRHAPGTLNVLRMSTSTDGGATWAAHTDIVLDAGVKGYWKIATNSVDRIDVAISGDSVAVSGLGSIYHFYYDGTWRQSDGTSMGSPSFAYSALTLVYNGATNPAWPTDIIIAGGLPQIVYNISLSSNTASSWDFARWSGSAWVNTQIDASVGDGVVDPSPVASLDPVWPLLVHAVHKNGSGYYELWRWTTSDNGATWSHVVIADDASHTIQNIYPCKVAHHPIGDVATLWLYGHYDGAAIGFNLGIKGVTA